MLGSLLENRAYKQSALDISQIIRAERGNAFAALAIDEYARRS
jgi:UDP:flavonoid glycosyltransferase YjiC (YdhE family)